MRSDNLLLISVLSVIMNALFCSGNSDKGFMSLSVLIDLNGNHSSKVLSELSQKLMIKEFYLNLLKPACAQSSETTDLFSFTRNTISHDKFSSALCKVNLRLFGSLFHHTFLSNQKIIIFGVGTEMDVIITDFLDAKNLK